MPQISEAFVQGRKREALSLQGDFVVGFVNKRVLKQVVSGYATHWDPGFVFEEPTELSAHDSFLKESL
jgi:hypothetical protein